MTSPSSPPPSWPPFAANSSSLQPPSSFMATSTSLLRRASGALRGAAGSPNSVSTRNKDESLNTSVSSPTTHTFINKSCQAQSREGDEHDSDSEQDHDAKKEPRSSSFARWNGMQPKPQTLTSSTGLNKHLSPTSTSNHDSTFLSPKAASSLLSPDERAFRGGSQQSASAALYLQPTTSYHSHLTPEECAFRGIPYLPIPSSPNSALAELATGATGARASQREGRWGRFRTAVSNSKGKDKDSKEDGTASRTGFMRSSSPVPRSPSQSPELVRNQLPSVKTSSSKAEKLLGISSPTSAMPASASKADKLLGITSSSSPSTLNFNTMPSKPVQNLGLEAESYRTRSTSALRLDLHPVEMQQNQTEPVRSTPPHSQHHSYPTSRDASVNRNRSSSTASSFLAQDSWNASSSSFLGLGLSHTESDSNPYHSEQDSGSHSDFLDIKSDIMTPSGIVLGRNEDAAESDSTNSSPQDRTPSAEWGTFLPSLSKKESKDRLRETKERDKEKERERLRQLVKLKERRKEHERRQRERSYEETSSDGHEAGVKELKAKTRPGTSATDYARDPVTPNPPPSLWNSKYGKQEQTEPKSISPVRSKGRSNLSSILTGAAFNLGSEADSSMEKKSKLSSRVHASDLMAEFNLEKSPSPKRKIKSHAKTRSSSSMERFETPVRARGAASQHRESQNSTPRPAPPAATSAVAIREASKENHSNQFKSHSLGQYVAIPPTSNRKPVRGLFGSAESAAAETGPGASETARLRPRMVSRADSISSRKRLSSLLWEGFDLVLDSNVDAKAKAQETFQAIVDDDDAGTCASSDFEGDDGMENDSRDGRDHDVAGGYVSAEEGEPSPTDIKDGVTKSAMGFSGQSLASNKVTSDSPIAASFVTAPVKHKRLVSQKSPEDKLLPLPPLPDLPQRASDIKPPQAQAPASRALATLKSLPPLSSLVQECITADQAAACLRPKPWSSSSSSLVSGHKTPKLLSSSSSKDQLPKSWVGYVRAYSRGEIDLSNPPKPRAAPIVSFPTPRFSSSPNLVSPSFLGTSQSLRHQRSSSSFARFDGTFDKSPSPNLPSPPNDVAQSQLQKTSLPLPIPKKYADKTTPVMSSSASPAFKSPRKSISNSNLPRLSFGSSTPRLNSIGRSSGDSPMRASSEKMRMSRDDEESIMRQAEEVAAVGGEGNILAPRPCFEAQRQQSVRIFVEALHLSPHGVNDCDRLSRLNSKSSASTSLSTSNELQLIVQRLAQDLGVQCAGITLLDDANAYLLASDGIESNPAMIKGLGFTWNFKEARELDPKLCLGRSPSEKQIVEGLGVEFEEASREEMVDPYLAQDEEPNGDDRPGSVPRDRLFDAHTILSRDGAAFVVSDTLADWRFERREGAAEVRFYAGIPISSPEDGMPIGTVFVAHASPRDGLKREEREKMLAASQRAMQELEALRRVALKTRLADLDASILSWATTHSSGQSSDSSTALRAQSPQLNHLQPMSPMTLAARRGARTPQSLSVPASPTTNAKSRSWNLTHLASNSLQGAVNAIAEALSGLVYIARVGSDPLACSVIVRSQVQQAEQKTTIKSEAAWRMQGENIKLKPDPAAHLCALAATKRGLSVHQDPVRVSELLGLLAAESNNLSGEDVPSQIPSPTPIGNYTSLLDSAMIVPAGLKEGGRMWRGTEGWVLGIALSSTKVRRLGPEVSIYLLRFASLLAPLLLDGPRSPSPLVVPPRSSSNHMKNAGRAQQKKAASRPGELLTALKSAPVPPFPFNAEKSHLNQTLCGSEHPYSSKSSGVNHEKALPLAPSRSPLLQTQPLSAPPSTISFSSLSSPFGTSTLPQRVRKSIPQASPPPSQPLPLPPLF